MDTSGMVALEISFLLSWIYQGSPVALIHVSTWLQYPNNIYLSWPATWQ